MLPNPKIARINLPSGRHYQVEGYDDPFPSVTTVLGVIAKPALIPWARNAALDSVREALTKRAGGMAWVTPEWVNEVIAEARRHPDRAKTEAADFGTQAHILIDAIIRGEKPEIPPEMEPVTTSFELWQRDAGLEIHLSENMVYSTEYRYAGTMDAVASRGDSLVALDWKTGNQIYDEAKLQISAYAVALEQLSGQTVSEGWIVRLGKRDPDFTAVKLDKQDLSRCFQLFLNALSLWEGLWKK